MNYRPSDGTSVRKDKNSYVVPVVLRNVNSIQNRAQIIDSSEPRFRTNLSEKVHYSSGAERDIINTRVPMSPPGALTRHAASLL